jgi:SnoaL-like domain
MNSTLGHLMERNASEVFGQRDPVRRKHAIRELFTEDCAFFEAEAQAAGRDAIDAAAESILRQSPPEFVLRAVGPAEVIHDLGRLRWELGPPGAPPVVTGMDVAVFAEGRIRVLYTFLDIRS